MKNFVLKGQICYSASQSTLCCTEHGFVVCVDGESQGVFTEIPPAYQTLPLLDFGDKLIIPGLVDLHVHAPQYAFRSIGMDMELLDWLEAKAFPEEGKFADLAYAKSAYSIFVEDLLKSASTRACIFATRHLDATLVLMEQLENSGLHSYVGKVNMDRNAPLYLQEEDAERAALDTMRWIRAAGKAFTKTKPILTPRFIPSCSDALMQSLARIQQKYKLPLQSHLSENLGEIAWVKALCPTSDFYGDAYDQRALFGKDFPAIMAHCVHSGAQEIALMKERGVFVAHCPQSNTNLSSGIAPVRRYLDEGLSVGLGSDIAGGAHLSIFRAMVDAIQASKLRWRLLDESLAPLTLPEVFYLATKGGGAFFGKVGSFEAGYELDAVVLDDTTLPCPYPLCLSERLERMVHLSDDRHIVGKFVKGSRLF